MRCSVSGLYSSAATMVITERMPVYILQTQKEKKHTRNTQKLEPCRCRTSYVKVRGGKEEEGEGVGVGEGGGGAVGNDRQTNEK